MLVGRALVAAVLGIVIVVLAASAQPRLDLGTVPLQPGPQRVDIDVGPQRPMPRDTQDHYPAGPSAVHDPVFIGPGVETAAGGYGLSAWTARNPPVESMQTGWKDVPGWPVLGFTVTWGPID
jgi:hypothetical protein